jgi:hypothetical protein
MIRTMRKLLLSSAMFVALIYQPAAADEASDALAVLLSEAVTHRTDHGDHAYTGDTKTFRLRSLRYHPLEDYTDITTSTASFADLDADVISIISVRNDEVRNVVVDCRFMRDCEEVVLDQNPRSSRGVKHPLIMKFPSVGVTVRSAEAVEPVKKALATLIRFNQRDLPPPSPSTMSVREALEVIDETDSDTQRTAISRDDYRTKDIRVMRDRGSHQSAALAELDPDRIHLALASRELLMIDCKDDKKCCKYEDAAGVSQTAGIAIRTNNVDPNKIKQALQVLIRKAK